jgi:hypothetical protein
MEKPSTARIALKWGLIIGIVASICAFILATLKVDQQSLLNNLPYLIVIIGIILSINEFKNTNNHFLSFGNGLGVGTLSGAVSGIFYGIYSIIYVKYIDTEAIPKMLDKIREQMEEQGTPDDVIEKSIEFTSMVFTPSGIFIVSLILFLLVSFFTSLIATAIMKKDKPEIDFN